MANKGRSEQGLFGTVHHYDEHGKKVGHSEPSFWGGYTSYDAKGKKLDTLIRAFSADTTTMTTTDKKQATLVLDYLVATIMTMPMERVVDLVLPECSDLITTATTKAAMWQHACTGPMTVRRSGRYGDSEIISLRRKYQAEHLSIHTTRLVPQS